MSSNSFFYVFQVASYARRKMLDWLDSRGKPYKCASIGNAFYIEVWLNFEDSLHLETLDALIQDCNEVSRLFTYWPETAFCVE